MPAHELLEELPIRDVTLVLNMFGLLSVRVRAGIGYDKNFNDRDGTCKRRDGKWKIVLQKFSYFENDNATNSVRFRIQDLKSDLTV